MHEEWKKVVKQRVHPQDVLQALEECAALNARCYADAVKGLGISDMNEILNGHVSVGKLKAASQFADRYNSARDAIKKITERYFDHNGRVRVLEDAYPRLNLNKDPVQAVHELCSGQVINASQKFAVSAPKFKK